ncbi:cysteine-rich receptor-like protein kinase 8 [Tanacetum coccineum]|uniref:Cysteine-rich receptor-like protein kinase 8 n=1 Tax=Tanacetum coccineum TaxID=301880 RepID=A0ABQ5CI90_9ASTR
MVSEGTSNNTDTISLSNDQITSKHPLFLLHTDHPGLILISKKLTGSDNYSTWRRSMVIALNAKNKMKIVNGDFAEPNIISLIRALWERNNDMIISWILNIVVDQIVQLKQIDCTVEVYYHKLKGLWDEFDALEASYLCTCVCNCENGKENGERDQRKRLMQFLMGLDESYSNIRGQILLMQPLPSVVKAYNMVRQKEKQREGLLPKPATSVAFSMYSNSQRSNNNYQRNYNRSNYSQGESSAQVGHPLHEKFPSKPYKSQSQVYKPNRAVNMVIKQDEGATVQGVQANSSQTVQPSTPSETHMTARMDQLQNQLNQVLLMMQNNNHRNPLHGPEQEDFSWHPLLWSLHASIITCNSQATSCFLCNQSSKQLISLAF